MGRGVVWCTVQKDSGDRDGDGAGDGAGDGDDGGGQRR